MLTRGQSTEPLLDRAVDWERTFAGTSRFQVLECLGQGGFGTVYRALDRETGGQVALKVLRRPDPDTIFRLKKEFRSLVELKHPSLVRLRELHEEAGHWFFTMDLVEGTDLLSAVRDPRGAFDENRVRDAFRQLAIALRFIHVAQRVHRDVKPANVRVTPSGRVVLLDFGLVSNTVDGIQTTDVGIAGTRAYMSPEQARGERVGPEADWYSYGVVLYEAMVGSLPRYGSLQSSPEFAAGLMAPRRLSSRVPVDLNDLCVSLLRASPADRPDGQAVMQALGAPDDRDRSRETEDRCSDLLGRTQELHTLLKAYDSLAQGKNTVVHVGGESGVGKTALAKEMVASAPRRTLVLEGRCVEHESIPYKAFDQILDGLASFLLGLTDAESAAVTPLRAVLLPRTFPVLGRVPSIATAPQIAGALDDVGVKSYAFRALRDLFALLGERFPLLIVIDDVQWADAESLALLERLSAPPDAPNAMTVLMGRPLPECPLAVQRVVSTLLTQNGIAITLEPLNMEQSQQLARVVLGDAASRDLADAIARECGGNPLLLSVLAGAARDNCAVAPSLAVAVSRTLEKLPRGSTEVFKILCVAGTALATDTLCAATGLDVDVVAECCRELKSCRLIRTRSTHKGQYEVFHDRIRSAVIASWELEDRLATHYALAVAAELSSASQPELVASHFMEAGRADRAARHAVAAARNAHDELAFDQAAHFYRIALQGMATGDLQVEYGLCLRLGDALSACRRSSEAAEAYLSAGVALAGLGHADGARMLRIRAAQRLLESGHDERGTRLLFAELAGLGIPIPRSRVALVTRIAFSSLANRFLPRMSGRRAASEPRDRDTVRISATSAAAVGLASVDPWLSRYFQTVYAQIALRSPDHAVVGEARAREGMYAALLHADVDSTRARALLDQVLKAATSQDDPRILALAAYLQASRWHAQGRFPDALACFSRGHQILGPLAAELRGEMPVLQQIELNGLQLMGAWQELRERVDHELRAARERSNVGLTGYLQLVHCPLLALARDDPRGAEDFVAGARCGFFGKELWTDASTVAVRLYNNLGGGLALWGKQRNAIWRARGIDRVAIMRSTANWAYARALLGELSVSRIPNRALKREIELVAGVLTRSRFDYERAYADMTLASLAMMSGDREGALSQLACAAQRLDTSGMKMLRAVVLLREGQLRGAEGLQLVADATRFMVSQGVLKPERIAQVFLPVSTEHI